MIFFVRNKILPYILITRPLNLLIIIAAVYLGFAISKNSFSLNILDLVMFAPIVLSAAAGYCLNDLTDLEEDRINRPGRILVRNLISKRSCVIFSIVILSVSIILSALHVRFFIVNSSIITAIIFYNIYLKKTPFAGNLLTSILSAFPVLWGGLISGSVKTEILSLFFLAVFLHLPREILKDIEDLRGDKSAKKNTTAVFFGERVSFLLFYISSTGLLIYLIAILCIINAGPMQFILFLLLIPAPVSVSILLVNKCIKKSIVLLKISMVLAILFFLIRNLILK